MIEVVGYSIAGIVALGSAVAVAVAIILDFAEQRRNGDAEGNQPSASDPYLSACVRRLHAEKHGMGTLANVSEALAGKTNDRPR